MKLIGREKEIRTLEEALESKDSVFLAVYGRRRVGKTFLLRQTLSSTSQEKTLNIWSIHESASRLES